MSKAMQFKKWMSERMGHSPQLQLALEAIKELEQELGLVKISLEHKATLLNSCEIALEQEQFPEKTEVSNVRS